MDFVTQTSNDNWFKNHPEKIAGVEYETTSFYFPIMVKGTKDDVLRVTGMSENKNEHQTITNIPPNSTVKEANQIWLKQEADKYHEKINAERLPILNKIIEDGLKIKGITRVDIEDNGKTIVFGTKTNGVRYSVVGWDKEQIQTEYDFDLKTYQKDKTTNFEEQIREIKFFRGVSGKEKLQMIKQVNQTKNHLEHFEKIIFPFYEFNLGVFQPNKKLLIAKAKAKAIKIKLMLQ